jgi:hypothetical protein
MATETGRCLRTLAPILKKDLKLGDGSRDRDTATHIAHRGPIAPSFTGGPGGTPSVLTLVRVLHDA